MGKPPGILYLFRPDYGPSYAVQASLCMPSCILLPPSSSTAFDTMRTEDQMEQSSEHRAVSSGPPHRLPLLTLLGANVVSGIGNQLTTIAIPWFVLETTGSAAKTGITAFAMTLPILLTGLLTGTIVDHLGFKRVSVTSDLVSGAMVAAIPLLFATTGLTFWQLLVLVFLRAFLVGPGGVGRESMIPDLARIGQVGLERTNAMAQISRRLTSLIGPLLAGLLVAFWGAHTILWLDAASFLLSAVLVAIVVPATPSHATTGVRAGYVSSLRMGLQFLCDDHLLRALLLAVSFSNLLAAPLYLVIFPVYAKRTFDNPVALGAMFTSLAAGAIAGSVVFAIIGDRFPRRVTFLTAVLVTGIADGVLALFPPLPAVIVTLTIVGCLGSPINILLTTIRQERVPPQLRGRVFGMMMAVNNLTVPLGVVVAGRVLQQTGLRPTLLIVAGCYLPLMAALFWLRAFQGLDQRQAATQPIEYRTAPPEIAEMAERLVRLTEQERLILRLRFALDGSYYHTLTEVASGLRVQVDDIRRLETQALRKLKGLPPG